MAENAIYALRGTALIEGQQDDGTLNKTLLDFIWKEARPGWYTLLFLGRGLTGLLFGAITITIAKGIGMWGSDSPGGWAVGIINFVWWIGIGHAGTLISAILLLFRQKWRTSINRFAEAMTRFAVLQAALFPVLHTGRPWFAIYWLFPYPSTNRIWPQFKSPLMWDVFAVSTYFITSLLFWYLGLIPDLAALRDSSTSRWMRRIYGTLSFGWRGSARHWHHYKIAYLLLAGLATPLVLSVHTIVSYDFAVSIVPGWHETIFPPYFVAGAVLSGFALVMALMIPARRFMPLHRDFLPSSWAIYKPTWVDLSLLFGTICFFSLLFLLFLKFLPAVAVQEVKELRHELHREHERHELPEFSQETIHPMELEVGEEDER